MPPWGWTPTKPSSSLRGIPVSVHCWQGDDVGGFENAGEALGGGLAVTGNYPGKARTPDELRADFEKALSVLPGPPPLQPPRLLRRDGRPQGGPRRVERRPVQELDRLGAVHQDRARLQPDLLRPPEGGRRGHAHLRGQGHPPVLDRARHSLPGDRRRHRQGPRQDLPQQHLDPRRHEGYAGGPPRPARAPGRVAGRHPQEED